MTNEEMRKAIIEIKRHCLSTDCRDKCPAYILNNYGNRYCALNSPWAWNIKDFEEVKE